MKLSKPLIHMRLDQCQFFWWDPRIDPREPEYDPLFAGGFSLGKNKITNLHRSI